MFTFGLELALPFAGSGVHCFHFSGDVTERWVTASQDHL